MSPDNHNRPGFDASPPKVETDESILTALGWMRRARAEDELLQEVSRQLHRNRRRRLALASGLLSLGLITGVVWRISRPSSASNSAPGLSPAIASGLVGNSRTATVTSPERRILPDGSVMELIDGARVIVDFSGSLRKVVLERGKAHFQVTKNARRPFVVDAAGVHVRAVGTAFVVDRNERRIEVLVTNGVVAVAADNAEALADNRTSSNSQAKESLEPPLAKLEAVQGGGSGVQLLDAGKVWSVDLKTSATHVQALSDTDMTERTSWRIPQLEFTRTPLPDALAILNQHNQVQFEIADSSLNKLQLSGFLRADNAEGMVRLLEANFGIKATRQGGVISLAR